MSKQRPPDWTPEEQELADTFDAIGRGDVPDLTKEHRMRILGKIQEQPAGAPLKSECIRLAAEARKVEKLRQALREAMLGLEGIRNAIDYRTDTGTSLPHLRESVEDVRRRLAAVNEGTGGRR
jgi:hypothetical protein